MERAWKGQGGALFASQRQWCRCRTRGTSTTVSGTISSILNHLVTKHTLGMSTVNSHTDPSVAIGKLHC